MIELHDITTLIPEYLGIDVKEEKSNQALKVTKKTNQILTGQELSVELLSL